jgi:hypothetical protein
LRNDRANDEVNLVVTVRHRHGQRVRAAREKPGLGAEDDLLIGRIAIERSGWRGIGDEGHLLVGTAVGHLEIDYHRIAGMDVACQ